MASEYAPNIERLAFDGSLHQAHHHRR